MIAQIVTALISPLGTALFLGTWAWILGWSGRRRLALALGGLALLWLGGWSLPAVSLQVRWALERPYPMIPIASVPTAEAIVLLGGGIIPAQLPGSFPNLEQPADRAWHAARLFHAGKAPLIILSGGRSRSHYLTSEAQAMRLFMKDLGVPDHAMVLEERSKNTSENAIYTLEILRRRHIGTILLVTSALHMRRALKLFQAEDIQIIPAATDHEVGVATGGWRFLPEAKALEGSGRAIKEWIGPFVGR
ncbi:MAG: YdcF family protein [Magnetococcales bacterium]|nr:YdcF family protein [Magnetococcales bacterium]